MIDFYDEKIEHLPAISENEMSDEDVVRELAILKKELGHKVAVVGHHYQQDDVIALADYTGDSLQLARDAAKLDKEFIIFCGVHFMAETADMLTASHQKVILPDMRAGCSMADMAQDAQIERCWKFLSEATTEKIVPITYINCTATLKDFVGRNDGAICTSSNAEKVITWALNQGEKLLFFPDQHLGRNTCFKLGIPLEQMVVYNPNYQNGGLTKEQVQNAKVILWYGYCSVHQGFNVEQIRQIKKNSPETTIIVHPECSFEVVQEAHMHGSTSYIIDQIKNAKPGTSWAIGTEINLVNRLAKAYPHINISSLSPYQCLCTTMYRVRPRWLLEAFRSIKRGSPVNIIQVPETVKNNALKALERMLKIS